MIGFIIFKTLLKVFAITAKTSAVKQSAISGVIIASGVDELARHNRYNKPKENFKNKEQEEIKMIE
jgi:hypothetical protein